MGFITLVPLTEDLGRVTALLHYTSSSTLVNTILEQNHNYRWLLETHPSDLESMTLSFTDAILSPCRGEAESSFTRSPALIGTVLVSLRFKYDLTH